MLMCRKSKDTVSADCESAAKAYISRLYQSGRSVNGNARLIRQLIDEMKQRRYERILGLIAKMNFGEDTPDTRKKAAAARAMGKVTVPQDAYTFTAEDIPEDSNV